ncbi:hypothetical protein ACIA98_38875 [Streptomyces sp. NPDC051366]|uniref:hypothetical protein n=1 Tax=Streptomyces sp. NPDC051366 TaxID=3365652 RepID=UPI00379825BB
MGASGWDYVTEYAGSVEASFAALQAEVFDKDYGDGETYGSLAELRADEEFMCEEGTHSILDIDRVVHTTGAPRYETGDVGTLRPLAADRAVHHFGTDRPTVQRYGEVMAAANAAMSHQQFEQSLIGECRMRWTGLYVLLYTGEQPTHVGIFGYSGD